MSIMEHRTTFALDAETIRRLKKLAAAWHVSQAEVVRRALERTEAECDATGDLPLRRLGEYHRQGGLAAEEAAKYLSEVSEQRSDWGRGE
jgi:predicted transcriptional regulator